MPDIFTNNATDKRVWVTIYDLGKTTHLDYGWLEPNSTRTWSSGNYCWGSFYYVRGEVKAPGTEDTIYDTTVQVNPQATGAVFGIPAAATLDAATLSPLHPNPVWDIDDIKQTGGTSVTIKQGTDNYYWDHDN